MLKLLPYKSALRIFLSRFFPGLISLFSIPTFITYFGNEEYASLVLTLLHVNIINYLFAGWYNQSQLRFVDDDSLALFNIRFLSILSIIGIISNLVYAHFLNQNQLISNMLIQCFLIANVVFNTAISNHLIATCNEKLLLKLDLLKSILSVLIPFIFLQIIGKIQSLPLGVLSSFLIANFVYLWKIRKTYFFSLDKKSNFKGYVMHLKYGAVLSLAVGLLEIVKYFERHKILTFASLADLGVYSSAFDFIYKIMAAFFVPIGLSIHPRLSRIYDSGAREKVIMTMKLLFILSVIYVAIILFTINIFWDVGLARFLTQSKLNLVSTNLLILSIALSLVGNFSHKFFELNKSTHLILTYRIISIALQAALIFYSTNVFDIIVAYLIGNFTYMLLCHVGLWLTTDHKS